ncbi:hypothetical protein JTB14_024623 [Gonioctena quinquepunctata]|nr:hypothetical protein JTB14_024623 [Gonioctena quinquepunctata]
MFIIVFPPTCSLLDLASFKIYLIPLDLSVKVKSYGWHRLYIYEVDADKSKKSPDRKVTESMTNWLRRAKEKCGSDDVYLIKYV